jgi:hypothetical protein
VKRTRPGVSTGNFTPKIFDRVFCPVHHLLIDEKDVTRSENGVVRAVCRCNIPDNPYTGKTVFEFVPVYSIQDKE